MPSFLTVLEELCVSSRVEGGTCGSADDSVRILGKEESQDLEFQKEYLKLVDEEPISVMPNEMENLVREDAAPFVSVPNQRAKDLPKLGLSRDREK